MPSPKKVALAGLALAFIGFNAVAFMQAWSMSHIARAGEATRRIEDLTPWDKLKVLAFGTTMVRKPNLETPASRGLAFEDLTLSGATVGRLAAWGIPAPAGERGRWVLLLHGYLTNRAAELNEAAAIHSMGWGVLLPDFPGHGDSDGDSTSIGYKEGADVARLVAWLRRERAARTVVVYGMSMGAAAAVRGQADYGAGADGLILECPFDRFLDTVKNRFRLMGLPPFPAAQALVFWGGIQQGVDFFAYRLSREAPSIRCLVLVLAGSSDERAPVGDAQAICDALPPADVPHLVVFEGAGHQEYLLADPGLWKAKVANFLDSYRNGE